MNGSATDVSQVKPDYGIDAPAVLRNLFLFGFLCLILGLAGPEIVHVGPVAFRLHPMFLWTSFFLLAEGFLYLLYVKVGKFHHRDFMLSLHSWKGDERVLDVGCGRGLLLVGAARRLDAGGHATGIDIWSTTDLSGNAEAATLRNLNLEEVASRCTLVSESAAEMPFAEEFDVVVSNLCLHNIYDRSQRRAALRHIARVLKPGGVAILSDYKLTGEYAEELRRAGFAVSIRRGRMLTTFPPLAVVVARKPL
jgi:SAM-dependent methyltransferase